MMSSGKLIVIEGLEGAGKTTAMRVITEFLRTVLSSPIKMTREPGGTALGESVRTLLKTINPLEPIDNMSELLLIYAARVQHLNQVIKPALAKGYWVICDRFELSTFAYQGGGRAIPEPIIAELSQFCLQGFQPDLTLFLDITPEIGLKRAAARGQFDRFEQEPIEFFNAIYKAYHQQIAQQSHVKLVDASQPLDKVQSSIEYHLQQFISLL